MAWLTGTLRGDGLARAQRALADLQGDPLRLDHERQRYSRSPPPYTSNPSGTTTRSASPDPPSEEQQCREERRFQLGLERRASEPYHQFEDQIGELQKRIWNAHLNREKPIPVGSDAYTIATEIIKKRWIEQGIWNNKWNQFASGRWKHEEPLELESESEADSEARPSPPLFSFAPTPQPKPKRSKSDDEKRWIAERRVVRQREREASRPYHQFVYQISKERERIQEESENGEGADAAAADINTRAYENIKNTWTKRGIWNGRWGILPGMSWKHEKPLEEEAAEGPAPVPAQPLVNGCHEAGEAPAIRIFESPPIESSYRQASGALSSPQQGPPTDIDSAKLENGHAERSFSLSYPHFSDLGKRVLRPATRQALLPSKRKATHQDGQLANASPGPIHPSKVSKAARKRKGPQRQLNMSQKESSDGLPLSSGVDAVEPQPSLPPVRGTRRRSKRTQPPVSSVAKDLAETAASVDPLKRTVRSRPDRKMASDLTTRNSAKPRGVSKRQSAKNTPEKARKK